MTRERNRKQPDCFATLLSPKARLQVELSKVVCLATNGLEAESS